LGKLSQKGLAESAGDFETGSECWQCSNGVFAVVQKDQTFAMSAFDKFVVISSHSLPASGGA